MVYRAYIIQNMWKVWGLKAVFMATLHYVLETPEKAILHQMLL